MDNVRSISKQDGKNVDRTASLEILSGLIRVGDDHTFGTPYDLSVTFSADEGVAVLKGVDKDVSLHDARAIKKVLKQHGLTWRRNRKKEKND